MGFGGCGVLLVRLCVFRAASQLESPCTSHDRPVASIIRSYAAVSVQFAYVVFCLPLRRDSWAGPVVVLLFPQVPQHFSLIL